MRWRVQAESAASAWQCPSGRSQLRPPAASPPVPPPLLLRQGVMARGSGFRFRNSLEPGSDSGSMVSASLLLGETCRCPLPILGTAPRGRLQKTVSMHRSRPSQRPRFVTCYYHLGCGPLVARATQFPFHQSVLQSLDMHPPKTEHPLRTLCALCRLGCCPLPVPVPRPQGPHTPPAVLQTEPRSSTFHSTLGFFFCVGQDWPAPGTSPLPLSGAACHCVSHHLGAS